MIILPLGMQTSKAAALEVSLGWTALSQPNLPLESLLGTLTWIPVYWLGGHTEESSLLYYRSSEGDQGG